MNRFLLIALLVLLFCRNAHSQAFCLIVTETYWCNTGFNPLAPNFCQEGVDCNQGAFPGDWVCPGVSWEVRNLSTWNDNRPKAVLAESGQWGQTGNTSLVICSARRQCVCKNDPGRAPGQPTVCTLGDETTQENLQTYSKYIPPAGGGQICPGQGGD